MNLWGSIISFVPSTLRAISQFRTFNDLYKKLNASQKNVQLFQFGHWVKIKVGGTAFIVRRRTLTWYPGSVFSSIAEYDRNSSASSMISDLIKTQFTSPYLHVPPDDYPLYDHHEESPYEHYHQNEPSITTEYTDDECSVLDKHPVKSKIIIIASPKNSTGSRSSPYFKFEKDTDDYYLIDRDPTLFTYVLGFMRTGEIGQLPANVDINLLLLESQFYHLYEMESKIKDIIREKKRSLERNTIYDFEINIERCNDGGNQNQQLLYFIVEKKWFDKWNLFTSDLEVHDPPPHVNNYSLMKLNQHNKWECRENLVHGVDYICCSKETWLHIQSQYPKSGPMIIRNSMNIYDRPLFTHLQHF